MQTDKILDGLVRVGTVSAIDAGARSVRVLYEDRALTSGWLHVLQHFGAGVAVVPDGGHGHTVVDTYTGGGSALPVPHHAHEGTSLTYWMPGIGERVLVLYLPIFNADGFVLGGI